MTGHTNVVESVAFSPDGTTLASESADKTIRSWDANVDAWIARACAITNRNLTRAEWEQCVKSDDETWEDYKKNPTCPNLPVEE